MSISAKGRRRITVGGQTYIWYVAPDDDSPYNILHIVSDDRYLILSCPLRTKTAYAISKGRRFQAEATDGVWRRYLLPFDIPESVTPGLAEKIIVWATEQTGAVPAAQNGEDVPV